VNEKAREKRIGSFLPHAGGKLPFYFRGVLRSVIRGVSAKVCYNKSI